MRNSADETRSAILKAAHSAFFHYGYSRVWMTEIAATAGITKRTLYRHFESKDALLGAMLEQQSGLSTETFARSVDVPAASAPDLVARIFSDLYDWAQKDGWSGPGITRLAMELGDLPGHPAMRFAARHKALLEALLSERLSSFGVAEPKRHAREIWLLLEGAMILALVHRDGDYIRAAAAAAGSLLQRGNS
jgi:AcrR family transcriptional regulator